MIIDYLQDQTFKEPDLLQIIGFQDQPQANKVNGYLKNILQRKAPTKIRKKKNPLQLKSLIKKAKVKLLEQNLIHKLKRTIIFHDVPIQILQQQTKINNDDTFIGKIVSILQNCDGLNLNATVHTIWSLINVLQITFVTIIYSLMLTFEQTSDNPIFIQIRTVNIVILIVDIIMNLITQRQQMGKIKKNLKQIGLHYVNNQMIPDFLLLIFFPLSFNFNDQIMNILQMIISIMKLNINIKRFQKFEYLYINKSEREQYYGLFKVFLLNFTIGHILSLLLNLMGQLNEQSWYDRFQDGIRDQVWSTKYIWGYYWGTNIMLTVGFGDLCASNQTQAMVLIFIQTFACITLAYNISCVGSIISQMKADTQQKKKKLKYFHKMCQENDVNPQLQTKIYNFIQESYQIKEAFEFDEYEQVMATLPKSMQSQITKQSNKHLFQVPFFNSLNNKTLLTLSQAVIRRITHPQQTIKRKGEISDFFILQKGHVGLVCKLGKSLLNGKVVQNFCVQKNDKPKVLSLDFIKRKITTYQTRSLSYSVLYYLDYERFMTSLKDSCDMDFGLFCVMKDKDQYIIGQYQLYKCQLCENQYHNRFECPKYHYSPLKQHVIYNAFRKQKHVQQKRVAKIQDYRPYKDFSSLVHISALQIGHKKLVAQYFDYQQLIQIENRKKYHDQIRLLLVPKSLNYLSTNKNDFQVQMSKIQQLFLKHSAVQQDFWSLQSDIAHNFKYYFVNFNPSQLINARVTRRNQNLQGYLTETVQDSNYNTEMPLQFFLGNL